MAHVVKVLNLQEIFLHYGKKYTEIVRILRVMLNIFGSFFLINVIKLV